MSGIQLLLSILQDFATVLKDNWAAIAEAIFNYEEKRVNDANLQADKAKTDLAVEKANEAVDSAAVGKSDSDIVDQAIESGSKMPKR